MSEESQSAAMRLSFAAVGAIAGLAVWGLFEQLPDMIGDARVEMALIALGMGFFGVVLALLGPIRLGSAALAAAALAVPGAALLYWASFRFVDVSAFLDSPHGVAAFVYLLSIAVPFVAAALKEPGGWRRYALLFDAAWNIVVRYAAAGLFVGVVWAAVMLSDALLSLVGITVIDWLLEFGPVPYLLSGLALGLGLAIVHQLDEYVSPFLLIQLLRALMPVLLVVLTVFILALPFRGLGGLFGPFSAAATLAAVALAGVTLITTAIHRDDDLSVRGIGMLTTARLLSVLVPVPAVLAVCAVWIRVAQYGLTPDRVAALVAALIVAVHALGFALCALRGAGWRGRLRGVNRYMALTTLAVAALWLTPALNAERLSVASQVARAEAGVGPAHLALWEMAHDWGHAGETGLERLGALDDHPQGEALAARIEQARRETSKWTFENSVKDAAQASLDGVVPVRPVGAVLEPGALDGLAVAQRQQIEMACAHRLPGGQPGCVIVLGQFDPLLGETQAILVYRRAEGAVGHMALTLRDGRMMQDAQLRDLGGQAYPRLDGAVLLALLEGRFSLVPAPRTALEVEGMMLFPQN